MHGIQFGSGSESQHNVDSGLVAVLSSQQKSTPRIIYISILILIIISIIIVLAAIAHCCCEWEYAVHIANSHHIHTHNKKNHNLIVCILPNENYIGI